MPNWQENFCYWLIKSFSWNSSSKVTLCFGKIEEHMYLFCIHLAVCLPHYYLPPHRFSDLPLAKIWFKKQKKIVLDCVFQDFKDYKRGLVYISNRALTIVVIPRTLDFKTNQVFSKSIFPSLSMPHSDLKLRNFNWIMKRQTKTFFVLKIFFSCKKYVLRNWNHLLRILTAK